jgi:putative aldouronate transport system substrate-binding protein
MKKINLLVCLLLILSLLAACGNASEEPNEQPQGGNGSAQTPASPGTPSEETGPDSINWDEHVTFTWWLNATFPNDYYTSYSDNPVVSYLQNRFNVTFNFEQPVAGTEADSLALMMGTGRYTDAIALAAFTGSLGELYDDGVIINIAEWLDYMPNLKHALETRPEIAQGTYDDEGRILSLPAYYQNIDHGRWTGLLYRHDILETMTGGNVQFPSGNDMPITIADWEYMLPLIKAYFEAAGFADYAPLIIPANGLFWYGELMNSFGATHHYYVRDDVIHSGLLEPGLYEYVKKMRDWFEAGWIHRDFASRTEDMFFMPNPPLVFGGMAGIFTGMVGVHMGDRLSMPDFGLHVDIRPIPSPLAEGISYRDFLYGGEMGYFTMFNSAVYTGNPDIGRFLNIIDYLYSEEGGHLRTLGPLANQIPPGYTVLERMGMPDGTHWYDSNGNIVFHPNLDIVGGHIIQSVINGDRIPGMDIPALYDSIEDSEEEALAQRTWGAHLEVTEVHPLPNMLTPTAEEAATLATNDARINDYRDQMLSMFIMGTTPLTEESWSEFLNQLRSFGIEENVAIWQTVYDRYLARGR